jgi:hypothetical protein
MSLVLVYREREVFVSANGGQTVQAVDPDARFLHLFPKLLLTDDEALQLGRRHPKLRVSSSTPDLAVEPAGGVKVRRALPNKLYQVGGSVLTRRGWLLALPPGIESTTVTMEWEVPLELGGPSQTVRHELTLRLRTPTEEVRGGAVYSMYLSTWPQAGGRSWFGNLAPMDFNPYAALDTNLIQGSRKAWLGAQSTTGRVVLHEALEVPPQSLRRLFRLVGLGQKVQDDD